MRCHMVNGMVQSYWRQCGGKWLHETLQGAMAWGEIVGKCCGKHGDIKHCRGQWHRRKLLKKSWGVWKGEKSKG